MKWSCSKCQKSFDAQDRCPFCESDKLKPGATNATINRELSALRRMLNKDGKIKRLSVFGRKKIRPAA